MGERLALSLAATHLREARAALGALAAVRHDAELAADTFDTLHAELDADASGVSAALRGAASPDDGAAAAVDATLVADAHAAALRIRDAVRRGATARTAALSAVRDGTLRGVLDVMDGLETECSALETRLAARMDALKGAVAAARKRAHSDLETAITEAVHADEDAAAAAAAARAKHAADETVSSSEYEYDDDDDDDDDTSVDEEEEEEDETYTTTTSENA